MASPWLPQAAGRALGGLAGTPPPSFLDDLAQQHRRQAALDDALRMDVHFGRRAPDNPFAGVGDDPVSDMVGATAAPRHWLEAADYNRAIEKLLPAEPQVPLIDMLLRNDRTRSLVNARLDRLDPTGRAGSLGVVARQAEQDAALARADQIARSERMREVMPAYVGAAGVMALAGAGGIASLQAEAERKRAAASAASDERARFLASADVAMQDDPEAFLPRSVDIGLDDPVADMVDDIAGQYLGDQPLPDFTDNPPLRIGMDTPQQAESYNPGPSTPVGQPEDIESLPGPQMRSVRALIRGGISPARALEIITRGSAMTQAEYSQVTGARR